MHIDKLANIADVQISASIFPKLIYQKKQQQKQFHQLYIDKPIAMQMSFAFVLTQRLKWIVILLKYWWRDNGIQ